NGFARPIDHARAIKRFSAQFHGARLSDLVDRVHGFAAAGLMVTIRPSGTRAGAVTPPITSVAILTSDRPRELRRALGALAAGIGARRPALEVLIADDSRSSAHRRDARKAAAALSRKTGWKVFYADRARRQSFVRLLAE